MKIRIKFAKQGLMKFIGHLDIMRYFQKAIRRADIDIKYSEGFSPHQIMSFASPLGVGLTSIGEYVDIEVNTTASSEESVLKLNSVMANGMSVLSYKMLPDNAKNAMSSVAAADYTVRFRDLPNIKYNGNLSELLKDFFEQSTIIILKKTKNGEKDTDIRPAIYELSVVDDCIYMKLAAGSTQNIKPELVMQAFSEYTKTEYNKINYIIQREEIYADTGNEQAKFISLEKLGDNIE